MFEGWQWLCVLGSRGPVGESGDKPGEAGKGVSPRLGMRDTGKPSRRGGSGVARADQKPEDGV